MHCREKRALLPEKSYHWTSGGGSREKHAGIGDVGPAVRRRSSQHSALHIYLLLQNICTAIAQTTVTSASRYHYSILGVRLGFECETNRLSCSFQATYLLSMLRRSILRAARQMSTISTTPIEDAMRIKVRTKTSSPSPPILNKP